MQEGLLRAHRAADPSPGPTAGPLGTVGQRSQPVRERTQALNRFIRENTQGPSGGQSTGYKLQKLLSEQPSGRGPWGWKLLGTELGTEERTRAVLPATCPAPDRTPHLLRVKVQWEAEAAGQAARATANTRALVPVAQPESTPPRSLLGI